MLFGDSTKGSYDFLGGSEVDVRLTSYLNILSILTFNKGKMGKCTLSAFILERSTFIYIRSNNNICIYQSCTTEQRNRTEKKMLGSVLYYLGILFIL